MTHLEDRQIQDVAVLVASLDTTTADALLSRLTSRQAQLVRQAVAGLANVPADIKESLAADFMEVVRGSIEASRNSFEAQKPLADNEAQAKAQSVTGLPSMDASAVDTTAAPKPNGASDSEAGREKSKCEKFVADAGDVELHNKVVSRDAAELTSSHLLDSESRQQHKSHESSRIASASGIDQIARLLKHEHPQTITAVISTLAPARAAVLIQSLAADRQYDVVRRLAEMQPADAESLHEVEKELREQLQREQELASRTQDGWQTVRSILGSADLKSRSEIMDNLCHFDESLVSRLQTDAVSATSRSGFGDLNSDDSALAIESLIELESSVLVTLFDSIPHKLTATALAGASDHDLNSLMSRLPAPLAGHLRDELAAIGPLCLSEIHDAQTLVAKAARGLLRDRASQSSGPSRLRLSA